LCRPVAHFVPSCGTFCAVRSCGTFCAFPWHISLYCAVLWHNLCLPVAHKFKSLFVPCYGTFCPFLWHISLKVFLCHAVAHFVPSRGTWYFVPSCQELKVKNCKKCLLDSLDTFFSRGLMNERIFQCCKNKV
jgi:hypothetical protein